MCRKTNVLEPPLHADFYFRLTAVFPALPITSLASQAAFPLDYDEAPWYANIPPTVQTFIFDDSHVICLYFESRKWVTATVLVQ